MNEMPRSAARTAPEQKDGFTSDESIENAALAGAAAVQRLVAERNNLRNRLAAQQHELAAVRALNEELRRRLYVIHQHYVEVAKRVIGNLEQFDGTIREVVQDAHNGAATPSREGQASDTATLAQRLAATGASGETEKPDPRTKS